MGELQRNCFLLTPEVVLYIVACLCYCKASLDTIYLLNPPEFPVSAYPLRVQYSCSKYSMVQLQVLVFFDTGTTEIFQRQWVCSPGSHRTRLVWMKLPDWLVYQPDWIIQMSDWVLNCIIRTWISSIGTSEPNKKPLASTMSTLTVLSPFSRPFKEHLSCPCWETEMLWKAHSGRLQCSEENEVASLLSSLYASTGENFGITKSLQPFTNRVLESLRLKAITYPWCAFSLWVLLDQPCRERLCGLFHHIDEKENFASPTLFLKKSGHLHVQFQGENGQASAFLSSFTLPLGLWCHIRLHLEGKMGKITAACTDGHKEPDVYSSEYRFSQGVKLDDTNGYFVIGGGNFIKGIEGFYGPIMYHRTRSPTPKISEIQIPEVVQMVNISGWLHSCQQFQSELDQKISDCSHDAANISSEECMDLYTELTLKANPPSSKIQCSLFEPLSGPHRHFVAQLVKMQVIKHGTVNPAAVGRALYSAILRKMTRNGSVKLMNRLLPPLLQAGCLGDDRALHLASVLYSSGLGVKKQPFKAWLLSLLAAQKDWRLALLRMGHLHHVGDQGVPADPDLSFAYYSNIARQTSLDTVKPSSQQIYVETIYLNDEETLQAQTDKNHDIFQWLELQARNGVASAEQAVARMLFWGQQGVTPDIQTAVRHYERGATRLQNPLSMYDYAIVLLMGQGIPQDVPRAVTFLKKAIDQGFTPAMTALGWYYEQYERNYERAVELWEQADLLNNPDAAMNLGVLYLQGLYPGKPADKVEAYKYFHKSAQRGHMKGGIALAEIWSQGIPGFVARRPSEAVLWVKWAAEQNGYLGMELRKGMNAYLKGNWFMALIYYLICAECGFKAAQFNTAYLCEHSPHGSLNPAFKTQCMLRYYNLSVQNQDPSSYALVKIGDLFYDEHTSGKRAFTDVAEMYKEAALKNDPQGWYSLGLLIQEGMKLPPNLLAQLNLLQYYFSDKHTLLTVLYHRCQESNNNEAYLPCTLALLATQLDSIQTIVPATVKLLSAIAIAVGTLFFLKILQMNRRHRTTSGQQSLSLPDNSQPPEQEETAGI